MKKPNLKVLAITAGLLAMGGAFAQTPSSNTNTVTSGLIEDEIVDQIDTGVEGKDFLFFGGYEFGLNSQNQIQVGVGKFFGKDLWLSLYDGYYLNASTTNSESVTRDSFSSDGVNVDYTDNSSSASTNGFSRIKNDLAFSMYLFNKMGGTAYWNMDKSIYNGYGTDPTGALSNTFGTTTTNNDTENHAAGTTSDKTYTALENKNLSNTFGINFNGVRTPYLFGDLKFYAGLSTVQLTMSKRYINIAYNTKTTLNGSTVDEGIQPVYSGTYDYNTYTPAIAGELGLTLPKMWDCVTPTFTLGEGFTMSFQNNSNSYEYERNTLNNSTTLVRTNTSYSMIQGKYTDWKNTLTPSFTFDFDFSDSVVLKANLSTAFTLQDKYTGANSYTQKDTEKTTTIATGAVTTSETIMTGGNRENTDTFTTTLTPAFNLGFTYKVVPEKFNINMGVSATSGTLTWTKTTRTNSHIPTISTTTITDTYGNSTITGTTYTPANGDGVGTGDATAETQDKQFASGTPSADANFGFTWFLGEKAQVDAYILSGFSGGAQHPTWAMNLTFGLRF